MVSLQWIRGYSVNFSKMQKRSIFVMNRLKTLDEHCQNYPVRFDHINGENNPADYVSRETSFNQLSKTNFYSGPRFLREDYDKVHVDTAVTVPNPFTASCEEIPGGDDNVHCHAVGVEEPVGVRQLVSLNRFSSVKKLIRVYALVLEFVYQLKVRVGKIQSSQSNIDFRSAAFARIIEAEQRIHHPDLCAYFDAGSRNLKDVPQMVNQLNLVRENSVIRVKSKFPRTENGYPTLLPKKSLLTEMIIRDCHEKMAHIGTYTILRELRPYYYITNCYSMVRRVIRNCVKCLKLNSRCIGNNQNVYRNFRMSPKEVPFAYVFIDYAGPWKIKTDSGNAKVWLLLITCCWSRAGNIKICRSLNVQDFLRAIQLHIYEMGLFHFCSSDLGSQICSGTKIISNFLDDMETKTYLQDHGIQHLEFSNYPKGNSTLGSLIEAMVKQVKLLINKSIGKNVLVYADFEFMVTKVTHLINRRPVAFKDSLRSLPDGEIPTAITPEMLVKGRELVSVNVVPQLQPVDEIDPDWTNREPTDIIRKTYHKLEKVRTNLIQLYHSEFLANLSDQAVAQRDRYKRVNHQSLAVGDVVLLEEKLLKQSCYPMGIVVSIERNSLGEVTAARVRKGLTREVVYRHAPSLILLLRHQKTDKDSEENSTKNESKSVNMRPRRSAAIKCQSQRDELIKQNLV